MTTTTSTVSTLVGSYTPFRRYPAGASFRRVRVRLNYADTKHAVYTVTLTSSDERDVVQIQFSFAFNGGPGVFVENTFELPADWGTEHQFTWASVTGMAAEITNGVYSTMSTATVYMSDAPYLDSFFQDYWDWDGDGDGDGITPTLADYIARGITGVTVVNLADVNDAIRNAHVRAPYVAVYDTDHLVIHAGVLQTGAYDLRLPEDIQKLVTSAGLLYTYTANLIPPAPRIRAGVVPLGAGVLGMRFESTAFLDDYGHYVISGMAGSQLTVSEGQIAKFGVGSFFTHGVDLTPTPSRITVYSSTDFDFRSDDFSIDMWVNRTPGSPEDGAVFTRLSDTDYYLAYEVAFDSNMLCFRAYNPDGTTDVSLTDTSTFPEGWTHIEVARTGSIFVLYVDGVEVAGASFYGPLAESTGDLIIGATPHRSAFLGYVDEVRMVRSGAVYTGYPPIESFGPPTEPVAPPDAAYLTAPPPTIRAGLSFATSELTAPSPTLTATSYGAPEVGDISLTAPPPTIRAGLSFATSELTAPSPTLTLGASVGTGCTAPSPTIRAYSGAELTIAAPRAKLSAQAHDSVDEQAIALTAPSPTLTVTTGAYAKNLKPKAPTLSLSGTSTLWVTATLKSPKPALTATGTVSGMASASLTFGYVDGHNYPLRAFSGALADLTIPLAEVTSSGLVGSVARAYLSAPTTNPVARTGATVLVEAPSPWLDAWAIRGGTARLTLSTPRPRLEVRAGTSAALLAPAPKLTSRALRGGTVLVSLSAPEPSLASASGTQTALAAPSSRLSAHGYTCAASSVLNAPKPNLVGYGGAVCRVTMTGKPTVQVMGATGGVSSGAVTCPLFELTAAATTQSHGGANLLAPAARVGVQVQAWLTPPGARLTAIGTAVVTATYEAYAVNLLHAPRGNEQPVDEVTRYTNFPFTHIVRYQSSYYGANSTGLYLLEGTTDAGAPVAYDVKTAVTDFKSPMRKNVASAYFGGRLGPDTTVTLHAGEGKQTQPYTYTTPRGQLAQNYRQVLGKGVRQHRYYAIGVAGSGALDLDTVELDTHNMTRRI